MSATWSRLCLRSCLCSVARMCLRWGEDAPCSVARTRLQRGPTRTDFGVAAWHMAAIKPQQHRAQRRKNPLSVGFGNPCCHNPAHGLGQSWRGASLSTGCSRIQAPVLLCCAASAPTVEEEWVRGGLLGTPPCRLACPAGLETQPRFEVMSCSAGEATSCSSRCLWSRMIHMELPLIS